MTDSHCFTSALSAVDDTGASDSASSPDARLHRESRTWLTPFIDAISGAGMVVLDLGCGRHGTDASFLADSGFTVFACDRVPPYATGTAVHAFVSDIAEPLPVRTGTIDTVLVSLSSHYFSWDTTISIYEEIHRVLRPGGALLLRVNADDDVNYGAGIGEEIEPGYFHSKGEFGMTCKRFFTEDAVRTLLNGLFDISHLRHCSIDRYETPKQIWECLAGRRQSERPRFHVHC